VTPAVLSRLLTGAPTVSKFRALVEQLLLFFAGTYKEVFGFEDPPLHDPCAVAYVIEPSLFKVGCVWWWWPRSRRGLLLRLGGGSIGLLWMRMEGAW